MHFNYDSVLLNNYDNSLYTFFIFQFIWHIEDAFEEQFDILNLDKFKHFKTLVASQMRYNIYGILSICDNIELNFAIQTKDYNPKGSN